MPDAADPLFLADLYRALVARATRLATPEAAATVDRDGDALVRLLTGFLDQVPPATGALCTLRIGWGGACKLEVVTQEPD